MTQRKSSGSPAKPSTPPVRNRKAGAPAPVPTAPEAPLASSGNRSGPSLVPLLVCLALYAVLTLGLILRVPIGNAPDENNQFEYVGYVAEHGAFPVFERTSPKPQEDGGNSYGYEFHQPPAYYLLGALVYKLSPSPLRPLTVRGLSLACGLGVLLCAWFGVAALFSSRRELPILTTGLLAASPLLQGVGTGVSNDALAALMGALIFCTIARLSARSTRPFDAALLGLLGGLAALAKNNVLILAPMCILAAWYFGGRKISIRARDTVLCAAVLLAVCGPWLWRNVALYGDPLARAAFEHRFRFNLSRIENFRGVGPDTYLRAAGLVFFCTSWGILGGPGNVISLLNPFGTRGPRGLLAHGAWTTFGTMFLMICCAGALICAALGLMRAIPGVKSWPTPAKRSLVWWLVGMALVIVAFLSFNAEFFQAQARYIAPALLPLALFFVIGWREVWGKRVWAASWGFGIVLLVLWAWNVFGWKTLV